MAGFFLSAMSLSSGIQKKFGATRRASAGPVLLLRDAGELLAE